MGLYFLIKIIFLIGNFGKATDLHFSMNDKYLQFLEMMKLFIFDYI